jgi:hypothetical protein
MVAGFALLNLNPYLQDFFSLARGYGLASGLLMGALFFLWMGWSKQRLSPVLLYATLSMTCASLAVLANYAWLNAHLPLLAANVLLLALDRAQCSMRVGKRWIAAALVLIAANAWFLFNVAVRLFGMKEVHHLEDRNTTGLIAETLGSLIQTYFYGQPVSPLAKPFLIGVILLVVSVASVALSARAWQTRKLSFATLMLVTLLLAAAVTVTEHYAFDVQYPFERLALYYVPIAGVLAMFLMDGISLRAARRGMAAIIAAFMIFHFGRTANLTHTLTWSYEAHTREAALEIGRFAATRGNPPIRIGSNWVFEPTLNYYRKTLHYEWLTPATRNATYLEDGASDLIYCFEWELAQVHGAYTVIRRFSDPNTVLIEPVRNMDDR